MKDSRTLNAKKVVRIFCVILLLYVCWVAFRSFKNSLLLNPAHRLNIVFYGKTNTFLSLGIDDGVNYRLDFSNNLPIIVPGGYGTYKLGALYKLATLEKKPQLTQRTFSSLTSTYVNYYFYSDKTKDKLTVSDIFLSKSTNASFLDRATLFFTLFNKRASDFVLLSTDLRGDDSHYEDVFYKKYSGYFYKKILRDERLSAKIVYHTASSARILSRIIEGEGIHIVDLSYTDTLHKDCIVTKNTDKDLETDSFLHTHFGCIIKKGDTDGQDIIIDLGQDLEKIWE
jgi:hypothetical protein